MKPIPLRPTRALIPALVWLHCQRCAHAFRTTNTRSCCDPCQDAQAEQWPGVIELPMEMSGT